MISKTKGKSKGTSKDKSKSKIKGTSTRKSKIKVNAKGNLIDTK